MTIAQDNGDKPVTKLPEFMTSRKFAATKLDQSWLVENILVKGQPAVIAGPKKCLKTTLALDLAISLGTGTPFLGQFTVPKRCSVAMISGESCEAVIQQSARRICRQKSVSLERDCRVVWSFTLPLLHSEEHRSGFQGVLRDREVKLVIIDPLYLCRFAGASALTTSSLYDVGAWLLTLAKTCLDAGATPVVVHHAANNARRLGYVPVMPLELDDLALSAVGKFARQWILLSRTKPYIASDARQELFMTVGGSAGHSGCWRLRVWEGVLDKDVGGRSWQVTLSDASELCARYAQYALLDAEAGI